MKLQKLYSYIYKMCFVSLVLQCILKMRFRNKIVDVSCRVIVDKVMEYRTRILNC